MSRPHPPAVHPVVVRVAYRYGVPPRALQRAMDELIEALVEKQDQFMMGEGNGPRNLEA